VALTSRLTLGGWTTIDSRTLGWKNPRQLTPKANATKTVKASVNASLRPTNIDNRLGKFNFSRTFVLRPMAVSTRKGTYLGAGRRVAERSCKERSAAVNLQGVFGRRRKWNKRKNLFLRTGIISGRARNFATRICEKFLGGLASGGRAP
jgi:hypothetical protein